MPFADEVATAEHDAATALAALQAAIAALETHDATYPRGVRTVERNGLRAVVSRATIAADCAADSLRIARNGGFDL